jgi:hypothetical protein
LIPVLASNLAASNPAVRSVSTEVFDSMRHHLADKSLLSAAQVMSNLLQFGSGSGANASNTVKSKAILLEKFTSTSIVSYARFLLQALWID